MKEWNSELLLTITLWRWVDSTCIYSWIIATGIWSQCEPDLLHFNVFCMCLNLALNMQFPICILLRLRQNSTNLSVLKRFIKCFKFGLMWFRETWEVDGWLEFVQLFIRFLFLPVCMTMLTLSLWLCYERTVPDEFPVENVVFCKCNFLWSACYTISSL